ncbi:MAG: DUF1343 domain-containing protein [Defluviitaleaceae bacterium]|nr:DUF1343 domain-containing protein [Defluviitaleaceae bacterium]
MSVKLGIDLLEKNSGLFDGRRVGLLTNCTGVNSSFESTVDLFHEHFNLKKFFAPEHGVRGNLQAGVTLESYTDHKTGLPVVSLYGENRRPTKESLSDLDIIAFDIQDVGSRFYTYIYSMACVMQSCAEHGKKFVVFDRPNPLNAAAVEGNILQVKSFIGMYPMPQRYGLTIGECARLFNEEYGINCDLTVVAMDGYARGMYFEDTGVPWIVPSPNIPTVDACFAFNCSCVFEGTNVSEGRGTTKPFSFVGAPWIDAPKLADALNSAGLSGVVFRPHYFSPMIYHPTLTKYGGELCAGVEIHVINRAAFRPVHTGITMLYAIRDLFGELEFSPPHQPGAKYMIDCNTGNTYIREWKHSLNEVLQLYESDSVAFACVKEKYHLYRE